MLKSMYVAVICLAFLTAASAESRQFGYKCAASDKEIIAHYSYRDQGGYVLDSLTIDGQDYKASTKLSVARGTATFLIENYRDGTRLMLKMGIENVYQLGQEGTIYQMLCYPIRSSPNQRSSDQL